LHALHYIRLASTSRLFVMDAELKPGLYIIPTPIGNLKDITLRALEYLKACDVIYCEDTRVSNKLLQVYGIKKTLLTYHEHNASTARNQIIEKLQQGAKICLVSDAGMPLISDPGYKLIREIQIKGFYYTALPGACAAISGLCLSGMPTNQFFFAGFFDSKTTKKFQEIPSTLIFYESARRLLKTLNLMSSVFNDRQVSIVREISKIYEESIHGSFEEVIDNFSKRSSILGEIIIVLGPPAEKEISFKDIQTQIQMLLENHSIKDISSILSRTHKISKKQVYDLALKVKDA
jgi:16S rRNA (cytidine1402-2'-O)-methyltransferase